MSVTAATAMQFFNPLTTECGTEAMLGYPTFNETAATFLTPAMNLAFKSSSVMSKIAGSNTVPLSYTFWITNP